jgi:hypothetical protein
VTKRKTLLRPGATESDRPRRGKPAGLAPVSCSASPVFTSRSCRSPSRGATRRTDGPRRGALFYLLGRKVLAGVRQRIPAADDSGSTRTRWRCSVRSSAPTSSTSVCRRGHRVGSWRWRLGSHRPANPRVRSVRLTKREGATRHSGPAKSSYAVTTSGASPSTSPNGSKHSHSPTKSSSPAPSPTSSAAPASHSLDRGTHVLKGVPNEWRLFAVEAPLLGSDTTGEFG